MKERRYSEAELVELGRRLFITGGLNEEDALTIAKDLVAADMRGLYSHGISWVPMYLKRIENKCVNPVPDIKVKKRDWLHYRLMVITEWAF